MPDHSPVLPNASQLIDEKIQSLNDWRGETLSAIRVLVLASGEGIAEELKWRGTPVWSLGGMLCTGEVYQNAVKVTFAQGAALPDPDKLFNASLDGAQRRAIDFHQGDTINTQAFQALVKAAISYNEQKKR